MVVPGSGLSVSLDGDEVWVGSWEQLVLLRLTEEGLVSVGHEAPRFSAMGVDVRDGTALLGDWHGHMTLERQPGISASEIDLSERLFFTEGAPVRNSGSRTMERCPRISMNAGAGLHGGADRNHRSAR